MEWRQLRAQAAEWSNDNADVEPLISDEEDEIIDKIGMND